LAEEVKDGAPAPAEPVHTPLSEIVDKPRLQTDVSPVVDAPRQAAPVERPERKPKAEKPDDDVRFKAMLRETLEEREKRQAMERKIADYERVLAEHQRTLSAKTKAPPPDMFREPDKYTAYIQEAIREEAEKIANQRVAPLQERLSHQTQVMSAERVKTRIGDEKWNKLNEWIAQQPPQFHHWCLDQDDPYGTALAQYHQRTTLERVGDKDLDTLIEEEVAKRLAAKAGPIDPPEDDLDEDERDYDAPRRPAPKSFAGARSADPTRDTQGRFTGPRPLGELVAERQNQKRKR